MEILSVGDVMPNAVSRQVVQLRSLADDVDANGHNLTAAVFQRIETLLRVQREHSPPSMYSWFSLGTWNVVGRLMGWSG